MRKHTSIITKKNHWKKFHKLCYYINIEREIIILQLWSWYGNSGHLPPPPPKKNAKSCNLVSSEVLLKLCFIESNLL